MNIYKSPREMYESILVNGANNANKLNVIVNEDITTVLENQWESLLHKRFQKFKILDGVYGNLKQIPLNLKIENKEERIKNYINFLAFDAQKLRNQMSKKNVTQKQKQKETIEQRVYVDGDIKIKYAYESNNAKKVIIIFQGKYANMREIHSLEGEVTHKTTSELFKHDKYQFYKYTKINTDYDFIFLEDDFNYIHGWYTTHYGRMITNNLQKFISNISKMYSSTHLIGTSKGGYGAFHLGKDLECVDSITLIAPVIDIKKYIEIHKIPILKKELCNNDPQLFLEILEREKSEIIRPRRISILSGESDYSYGMIKDICKRYPSIRYKDTNNKDSHTDIIVNNYKWFLEENLGLV